jgi:hypothetical protein
MLKHLVLFKRNVGVKKPEFDAAIERFAGLSDEIPEIAAWWFRLPANASSEYEAGFISEFHSEADLEAYQVHPAHQELAAAAGTVATTAVFDSWD